MVDLPQHAGQIALLRDLLLGRSRWASEFRLNFFTPYLIGYGLALPLTLVMPIAAAMKVVLTFAYAAFANLCIAIRRELNSTPQLDAYYFIPFFGFAYGWGLYNFLVAAPVGLAFIWLCIRYARYGGIIRGLWLTALGLVLMFSHGLMFVAACSMGLVLTTAKMRSPRQAIGRVWPFMLPLLICVALFVAAREQDPSLGPIVELSDFPSLSYRFESFLSDSMGAPGTHLAIPLTLVAFLLPLLGGLRLDFRRVEASVMAAIACGVFALAPTIAWSTGYVFERFALFLLPTYAWLFVPPQGRGPRAMRYVTFSAIALGLIVTAQHLVQAIRFSREAQDFDKVLARAEPDRRALSLVIDPKTAGDPLIVYRHFPVWYQAEKHGLVDYNFAVFHPEVVRFARPPLPIVDYDALSDTPWRFDWRRDHGAKYGYFFVRSAKPMPASLFAGAECAPVQVAASGAWHLLENHPCTNNGNRPPSM